MQNEETSWKRRSFLRWSFVMVISIVSSRHSWSQKDRKSCFQDVARRMLYQNAMSLFESSDEKMALPIELSGGQDHRQNHPADADRHISSTLAHELNNILTVVQGHADRLYVKHQKDAVLAPNLRKIADAAHRAAELVRNAPKLDFNPPSA